MPVPLRLPTLATAAIAATVLAGCATGPQASPDDPLEPMNRAIFSVNDKLDQYVAMPVAKGYKAVTPEPVRAAVSNFYSNLADIGNFANNLLQGKGVAAAESFMRTNLLGATDLLKLAALDKYAFVRDAYLQRRRYLLGENTALPDYGDDEDAGAQPVPPAPAPAGTPTPAQPQAPRRGAQLPMPSSTTSKVSVAFGGIVPGTPRAP
ncbi:exported protein of unknown function (plasmid) [Cupriavidus taiwanensis]|uniref:Lipoprotein n=1 Tax=Cupriavidus taiwanensis TaxID=164546 RepID=A0A9Q7V1E0_9BURK|nr:MlaA family lipoprotein [Cupriavidus taiwanensis]SPD68692.1 exported protein of unknown function [Cupriavidus taiwanensis]